MVFIRTKIVKGVPYSYLVKSNWNSKRKMPEQEIIKYLGKSANVSVNDIPDEYKNNQTILAHLSSNQEFNVIERGKFLKETRKDILKNLLDADLEKCNSICKTFLKLFQIDYFFDEILRPVMYDIGNLWSNNKLDVGSEHVATNTAMRLISNISANLKTRSNGKTVLICTPDGEYHMIPCMMIEIYLGGKGFKVINLSPSAPTKSIIEQAYESKPDLILISITLEHNIKSGKRLALNLQKSKIPVLVGGQALPKTANADGYKIMGTLTMQELSQTIRRMVK